MFKKILFVAVLLLVSEMSALDSEKKVGRGWLQYEDGEAKQENKKNPDKSKEKEVVSVDNSKKMSEKDILLAILIEQKKQTKLQEDILHILKVTNDLPEMIEVNGKKCFSNSSVECFKMPIIRDAARIPVMKKWLENPTVENALEYYKWQSFYLNKISDVGYSLNFASKNTPTTMRNISESFGTLDDEMENQRERYIWKAIIKNKIAKNMELDIFMGKNVGFDIDNAMRIFDIYDKYKSEGVKVRFIFENQESLERINSLNKYTPVASFGEKWSSIPLADKLVSANSFKEKDIPIYATPLYLLRYNDISKNIRFNQVLGVGKDILRDVFNSTKNALILFKVVAPSDISGLKIDKENGVHMMNILDKRTFVNEPEEKERAQKFKELLEKEVKYED